MGSANEDAGQPSKVVESYDYTSLYYARITFPICCYTPPSKWNISISSAPWPSRRRGKLSIMSPGSPANSTTRPTSILLPDKSVKATSVVLVLLGVFSTSAHSWCARTVLFCNWLPLFVQGKTGLGLGFASG